MRRRQLEAARGNSLAVSPVLVRHEPREEGAPALTPRELRERAGLSVDELAQLLEVSPSYIRTIEGSEKVRQKLIEALT